MKYGSFLAGERKTDLEEVRIILKETIIISCPVTEAVAITVKRQHRDNHCPDIPGMDRDLIPYGFHDLKRAGYEAGGISKGGKAQCPGFLLDDRDNNLFFPVNEVIQDLMRAYLKRFRNIDHNRFDVTDDFHKTGRDTTAFLPDLGR